MSRLLHKNQYGFTIVELMIATAIFSTILIVITSGIISFTNQYYKGITSNTTQNVSRNAINEISQSIQFSSGAISTITPTGSTRGYCLNGKPYYYVLGKELNGPTGNVAQHVLITSSDSCPAIAPIDIATATTIACPSGGVVPATPCLNGPRELLGAKMRLVTFNINNVGSSFNIIFRVAYGDDDILCSPSASGTCNGGASMTANDYTNSDLHCLSASGSQYCDVNSLTTNVVERL